MYLVSTERKTALLAQFARVGKALGNPARLQLLDLLIQAERSVEALAAAAGMPVGNTSAQVRALHAAGLVTSRRDGTRIYYRVASDDVAALHRALCEVARTHLPDAEAARAAYLHSDDLDEPVSRAELLRRAEAGDVVVIAGPPVTWPRACSNGGWTACPSKPPDLTGRREHELPLRRAYRPGRDFGRHSVGPPGRRLPPGRADQRQAQVRGGEEGLGVLAGQSLAGD